MSMRRSSVLLLTLALGGCVTLTPAGAGVSVYAPPGSNAAPARRDMPDGCRKLSALPDDRMTESEMEGQSDPFRKQRNAAGDAGGNVLLVLKRMVSPRRDFECPGSSPIRDCPAVSGATFAVSFESYTCTPDALKALGTPKSGSLYSFFHSSVVRFQVLSGSNRSILWNSFTVSAPRSFS
jgi:hypothetical protein